MIPPKGFKNEIFPLRHRFIYQFGLNNDDADTKNSTILTLVKNYKSVDIPDTVVVNPKHSSFVVETGAICSPMSIIDKLKLSMHFTMTEQALLDGVEALKVYYMPIFFSFPEKLDAVDAKSTATVASLIEVVKDATEEDVTPLFTGTNLIKSENASIDKSHPVTSVNFTEVTATLNLTTDLIMESVAWDSDTFFKMARYGTNKGALQACVGRMKSILLTKTRPFAQVFKDKFVPRAVRRIVPYSFFGMLIHTPAADDYDSPYASGANSVGVPQIGVKALVSYDEWNADHNQDMATT